MEIGQYISEAELCEIVELYLDRPIDKFPAASARHYSRDEIIVRAFHGGRAANPSLQKELKTLVAMERVKLAELTIEQIGKSLPIRLSDSELMPYWFRLKHEFNLLLCTNDKKYTDLRKKIEREGGKSNTAIVGLIAAAVAGTVGVAWGALVPFVALLLLAVLRMGTNAYCASLTLDIPMKVAGKRQK